MDRNGWTKPARGAQLDRTHPLARGLVGCWPLNEGTGGRALDLSGYASHGTLTNMDPATDWIGGRDGWALDFTGATSGINAGDRTALRLGTSDFTIAFWLKYAGYDAANNMPVIVRKEDGNNTTGDINLQIDHRNGAEGVAQKLFLDTGFTSGGVRIRVEKANWQIPSGWAHWAWRRLGTTITLHLNGGQDLSETMAAVTDVSAVGADWAISNPGQSANGQMTGFTIYNRAISVAEIAWLYSEPYAMFAARSRAMALSGISITAPSPTRFSVATQQLLALDSTERTRFSNQTDRIRYHAAAR